MATRADLSIDQGTTFSAVLTLTDENGEVLDLNNAVAAAQVRKSYTSLTYTEFDTSVNVATGEVTLSLTPEQTEALDAGRYVYDVELTVADTVTRIVEGVVTVSPQVTR